MPRHGLTVIIPTKDRPIELRRLLVNIAGQDYRPFQVIIVDGGDKPIDNAIMAFPDFKIDRLRVIPASLTAQRNAGIRAVREDATLVAFFDDDIILEEGALRNMMLFWDKASDDVGGAGFNLTNEIYKKPSFFEKLFLVNADTPSLILRSGFQSKVSYINTSAEVHWLPGCAMVWKKDVFKKFMFDENFSGYARYEEVDFSYRVGKTHRMLIVADAKAQHLSRVETADFSFPLGKMEVVNRLYFVRKYPELSTLLCVWALLGIFLNNVLKGMMGMDAKYLYKAGGNLAGFTRILLKPGAK